MSDMQSGSQCLKIHVENLTPGEVMQAMRRMVIKPYLMLWAVVYAVALVIFLVKGNLSIWGWIGPAIILILLALAYEFSGRKTFRPMGYGDAVLDYEITPKGYRLTVGEQSADFSWDTAYVVKTRSNLLLYSDKNNSSILPKRCLSGEEQEKILAWAERKKAK